jgi:hypothetical protein
MGFTSREQNYATCLRPSAAGGDGHAFARIQLHRPNTIAVAAGGGAMFGGARVLEHCQKEPRGRKS